MAYVPGNIGVYPIDATSNVGKLRSIVRDTTLVSYVPESVGFQDFVVFSDADLSAFLTQGGDNLLAAAGWAYLALAAQSALSAASIKDFDLAIDTRQRAAELTKIADFYFAKADQASGESFEIVTTGVQSDWPDEFSEWPWWPYNQ